MAHSNLKNDFQTIRDKGTWDRHCILFCFFYGKTKAAIVPPVSPWCNTVQEVNRFHLCIFPDSCLRYKNTHHQGETRGSNISSQLHLCFLCVLPDRLQPVWLHVCLHAISASHWCLTTVCC